MSEAKRLLNKDKIRTDLSNIKLLFNERLTNYTHTQIGGPADILTLPKSKEEIIKIVKYCKEHTLPWTVLGYGSNTIIQDGGIRGITIVITEVNNIIVKDKKMIVDSGAKLIEASFKALENELTGLEFACGIPGSIGGAIAMNAGAYGGEIKDITSSVDVLLEDATIKTLSNEDLQFSYRRSLIQDMKCIVLQTVFCLEAGNYVHMKKKMEELTELRVSKQPLEYPSCGSVFKRPKGYFAGKLIQDAGLQGLRHGGAQVSEKHAGFIVNIDKATASDYVALVGHIQKVIKEKFDVVLETEVKIFGEERIEL